MTDITLIMCGLLFVLIGLISFVIFRYIRPFINAKIPENQWDTIVYWAKGLVSLAEKTIYGEHGLGGIRYDKVLEQLQELCEKHGYTFDETMLKSAVQLAWQTVIGKSDSVDDSFKPKAQNEVYYEY